MQVYVQGSAQAVAFYEKAFTATLICSYPNADGTLIHAELDIQGQILALSERNSENAIQSEETITGNTMQFCLQYGAGNEDLVRNVYEVLKIGAQIIAPLAPCAYSPLMTALIDKYGISWCLFV